jgi:hypothetical protein
VNGDYPESHLIEQLDVLHLKNYVKDRGWIEEPFRREEVLKFKSPKPLIENSYLEILIPSRKGLIDYNRIVEIAIESISAFEKRSFEDVLSQMLIFGDLLKFRISKQETKNGCIPISDGVALYQNACDLLIYSACAEISPKKNFPRALKDAKDFVEDCLIGQSQYGSFIAKVHCKLERPKQENLGRVSRSLNRYSEHQQFFQFPDMIC